MNNTDESIKEIWKDIPGYEARYQASTLGRIRSLDRKVRMKSKKGNWSYRPVEGKTLNFLNKINGAGYYGVSLCDKDHMVHRLVAITFLGLQKDKQVNHKDCDKLNNKIENLEWISAKENMQHAVKNGRMDEHIKKMSLKSSGENNPRAKLSNKQRHAVLELIKRRVYGSHIAKKFGINQASVSWLKVNVLKIKESKLDARMSSRGFLQSEIKEFEHLFHR